MGRSGLKARLRLPKLGGKKPLTMRENLGGEYRGEIIQLDILRIRREVPRQKRRSDGWKLDQQQMCGVFMKAVLQTSPGNQYVISIKLPKLSAFNAERWPFPNPPIRAWAPHRYSDGNICLSAIRECLPWAA